MSNAREARAIVREWLDACNCAHARIVSARTVDLSDLARASFVRVKVTGVPREQWAQVFGSADRPRGLVNADASFG